MTLTVLLKYERILKVMSEVYAKIKNVTVTEEDVERFINNLSDEQKVYQDTPEFRKHCAEQLIERELFIADAEDSGLDRDPEFVEALERTRRDMLGRFAVSRVMAGIRLGENEAKEYYENNRERFVQQGETVPFEAARAHIEYLLMSEKQERAYMERAKELKEKYISDEMPPRL